MYRFCIALLCLFFSLDSFAQTTREVSVSAQTDGTLGQTFVYELRAEFRSSEYLTFVPTDNETAKVMLYVRSVSTSRIDYSALSVSWVFALPDEEIYYGQNAVLLVPGQSPQVARTIAAQTEKVYRKAEAEYERRVQRH